jgi:hypothetical protein
MKIIILALLTLSFNTFADVKDDLKETISIKSCDFSVYNGEIIFKNCTPKQKTENVKKVINKDYKNKQYSSKRELNRKIDKKINKIFDKIF